jgi:putative ABC transport system ATP-binding protein
MLLIWLIILCGIPLTSAVYLLVKIGRGGRQTVQQEPDLTTPYLRRVPAELEPKAAPIELVPIETATKPKAPRKRPPLFALRGVHKAYQDRNGEKVVVLDGWTAVIPERGVTAILGPSGQGKSTLLNLLGGIDTPDAGKVYFRGRPLPSKDGAELRRYRARRVCFVFQAYNLVTHLSAVENAALPLLCRGVPRRRALAVARKSLKRVGLAELAHRKPAELSGGQLQRLAIARAFTSRSDVILADEPTGQLDPQKAEQVLQLFCRLARRHRRPVIVVSHNVPLCRAYCDALFLCTREGLVDVTERPEPGRAPDAASPTRNGHVPARPGLSAPLGRGPLGLEAPGLSHRFPGEMER